MFLGIPWVLLSLPEPDALPLTYNMAAVQGYHTWGAHTDQVGRDIFFIIT